MRQKNVFDWLLCVAVCSLVGCGGGGGNSKSETPQPITSSSALSSSLLSSSSSTVSSSLPSSLSSSSSSNSSSISVSSSSLSSSSISSSIISSNASISSKSSVSSSSSASNAPISGTAATGVAISGAVIAIDINGKISPPATTNHDGSFIVNVDGMVAPFILSITGTANGKQVALNSIATSAGQTVNITPLTDLILSAAAGVPGGGTLATNCTPVANQISQTCLNALSTATTAGNLDQAITSIKNIIAPLNGANLNPLNGSFIANGTGMDALLDKIFVTPALNQGETATVTLIATNTSLGKVALPASSGGNTMISSSTPSANELALADASSTALNEIKTCMDSFNSLFGTTNLTKSRLGDFIDDDFSFALMNKSELTTLLTQQSADFATLLSGFSQYDMTPLTANEIAQVSNSVSPNQIIQSRKSTALSFNHNQATSAWIHTVFGQTDSGGGAIQMVRGPAYAGCPGGWKLKGNQHLSADTHPRITLDLANSWGNISREWAFHLNVEEAANADPLITNVVIQGPGLATYGGNNNAVGNAASLKLTKSSNPFDTAFIIGDGTSFYQKGEAIQSCQDLVGTKAAVGTPCIDETKVAPGAIFSWMLRDANNHILQAFPVVMGSVPLSKAFINANLNDLFAALKSATPSDLAAVNKAVKTATNTMDDVFSFSYTQSSVYGSHADNCGLWLYDSNWNTIFAAEANATGHETQCTFHADTLNSGNLNKPVETVAHGILSIGTVLLGNSADVTYPIY